MVPPHVFRFLFEICEIVSGEIMLCKTPEITLPNGVTRKRRDVAGARRAARDLSESGKPLNGDGLQFYLGFILDGVEIYRNMSDRKPEFGILNVYQNPEFEPFEGGVKIFRTYWPYNDEDVATKVCRPTVRCSLSTSLCCRYYKIRYLYSW